MKTRNILTLALAVTSFGAFAQMKQLDPAPFATTDLVSTANFGVNQIFGDFADFSGAVVDDFNTSGGSVSSVAVAYELSTPTLNLGNIKGWQVSFFTSAANAANSGNALNANTAAQQLVATGSTTNTELFGTLANGRAFRTDVTTTGMNLAAGHYWVAIAPVLDFTNNGQTFILSNTNANANPGGNNSVGINPGNGFGQGTQIAVGTNAAMNVNIVPEPASLVALGLGIAAFARRRRSSK